MDLYRKHILTVTAVFLILIGVYAWLIHVMNNRQVREIKLQRVELLGEIITNGLKSIMLEGKPKEEFQQFIQSLAAEDIEAVRIFSENGTVLSSTIPGEVGQRVDETYIRQYKEYKEPSLFIREIRGHQIYSTVIVLSNDWPCQRCHGKDDQIKAIVDLEVSHRKVDAAQKTATGWAIFIFAASGAVLLLVSHLFVRHRIQRPLQQLEGDLRKIADGDLNTRTQVPDVHAFGTTASSVNRIAADFREAREALIRYESREMSAMEKMASIGELAATVAHEIKNPLAGISGALQVMVEDIPEKSPRREICNEILAEIERLDRAVKDLIAYAKPQEINPEPTDLNAVVEKAVAAASVSADQVQVAMDVQAGALPEMIIDPEQIGKVIVDVLLYQCTLMPDGGKITVSTAFFRERHEAEVLCSDTGPALSEEKIRSIFKPSFSTKRSGTGLSLAIGRNIVENHGGRIRIESELGIGNAFHIIIPVKR